jgi:hypothetical protein
LKEKQIHLILTVFRKQLRDGESNGSNIVFHSHKVPTATRQIEWCQFYTRNTPVDTTCRFMLIDKRVHQSLLPHETPHALKDEDVLQYRSYLYTKSTSERSVVSFKGNLYVKFPFTYAVLTSDAGNVETGELIIHLKKHNSPLAGTVVRTDV